MSENSENFNIRNNTKEKTPSLPFKEMKIKILGRKYSLSLVFVGDKLSKKLNNQYRDKDKPANILSFPLDDNEGEIFINLKKGRRECKKFQKTFKNYVGFLFIHGLLHLKGFKHSSKMEEEEKKYCKIFKI